MSTPNGKLTFYSITLAQDNISVFFHLCVILQAYFHPIRSSLDYASRLNCLYMVRLYFSIDRRTFSSTPIPL